MNAMPDPVQPANPIGRRRDSRLRVEVPARVLTLTETLRAGLCDLSQSGARVRHGGDVVPGEECVLRWLEFEAFGTVIWSRGGYAGIEFDELLQAGLLLETRERADCGLTPDEEREALQRARDWYCGYR